MPDNGLSFTIATRVPKEGNMVLHSYGYKSAKNVKELAQKLETFQSKHREDALRSLSNIHPDKDLILHFHEEERSKISKSKEVKPVTKSNCSGADGTGCKCGGKCGEKSSADGLSKVIAGHTVKDWLPLAFAGVLFITSVIILTNEHSKSK